MAHSLEPYALLTLGDLGIWVRETISGTDEFAITVVNAASLVVVEAAGHPEWTLGTAPPRARLIAQLLAKRTYLNPDAVVRSSVGPLGESIVEDFARTLELTPAERLELEELGGTAPTTSGEMFFLNLGGTPTTESTEIYLADSEGQLLLYQDEGDVGT